MRLMHVSAGLVLLGCGTQIRSTVVNPPPHVMVSRPPDSVEIFTSAPPRDRPFVDVAFLEAEQESGYSVDGMEQFFAKLRGRAAAMGCDGLVFGNTTNAVSVGIDLKTPMNKKGIVATCIVYRQ